MTARAGRSLCYSTVLAVCILVAAAAGHVALTVAIIVISIPTVVHTYRLIERGAQ